MGGVLSGDGLTFWCTSPLGFLTREGLDDSSPLSSSSISSSSSSSSSSTTDFFPGLPFATKGLDEDAAGGAVSTIGDEAAALIDDLGLGCGLRKMDAILAGEAETGSRVVEGGATWAVGLVPGTSAFPFTGSSSSMSSVISYDQLSHGICYYGL